jgi:RND family efflux transporter MFP subunit
MQAVDIQLGSIEKRDLNNTVRANGELVLNPQEKADVNSLMGGIIRQILITEGKHVSKGQTLAYLENTEIVEIQKNYLIAQKELHVAEQEYIRQQALSSQGAGSDKNLQQTTANYEVSEARVKGLEKQLEQLYINPVDVYKGNMVTQIPVKAPISGVIIKINIHTGSYTDIQNPLMSIQDNSRMHCDLRVFEKDIHLLKAGQEVYIKLTNMPGTELKGVVREINKSFENETKSLTVHVDINDSKNPYLLPGMYVAALINTGTHKTDAVPDNAIASMEGKNYIFLLEDNIVEDDNKMFHFKRIEVVTGINELGYTQITALEDIPDDAKIVISNAFYVASMAAGEEEEE